MNQIATRLKDLKLLGMSQEYQNLQEAKILHKLGFTEGMEKLIEAEMIDRKLKRFERLKTSARFRYQSSLEELKVENARGLNKEILSQLASCALGHQACVMGKSVAYYNMAKLSKKLKMVKADGSNLTFFEKLSKVALLIIDDFCLVPMSLEQKYDLLEIIEDRHNKTSTILASQIPVKAWHQIIGEATIADAILDRLVHTAYRIELKGESFRKRK